MSINASTDGEKIIQLDGKIDKLDGKIDDVCKSIEKVVIALENLELTKVTDLEKRVMILEKKESEREGAYKLMKSVVLILGLVVTLLTIKTLISK